MVLLLDIQILVHNNPSFDTILYEKGFSPVIMLSGEIWTVEIFLFAN
jgi:hypothetical protein